MLDERLVGLTFTLQDAKSTGTVNFLASYIITVSKDQLALAYSSW